MNRNDESLRSRLTLALIVLALFLSPLILGTAPMTVAQVYGKIDQWRYRPTTDFRSDDWKAPNAKYRYAVLDYVAARIISTGMSEAEVEVLLGKPDWITGEGGWQYESRRPGWRVIDFNGGGLLIGFDASHRVAEISKNTWED